MKDTVTDNAIKQYMVQLIEMEPDISPARLASDTANAFGFEIVNSHMQHLAIHALREAKWRRKNKWPAPTMEPPTMEELMDMEFHYGTSLATDGCVVEPDGICPHGHPSWLLEWGLI